MGPLQCKRIHCHIARNQTIFDLNKFALQIHLCQKNIRCSGHGQANQSFSADCYRFKPKLTDIDKMAVVVYIVQLLFRFSLSHTCERASSWYCIRFPNKFSFNGCVCRCICILGEWNIKCRDF